jgi:hypothetical protein
MRLTVLGVAVTALVVVAAGCGGGGKSAATTTTTTTTTTNTQASSSTTHTMSTETTTTSASTTPKLSFSSAKNCSQLASLGQKGASSINPTSGSASLSNAVKAYDALAAAAPSAIRGDLQTVAGTFAAYVQALQSSGYKVGQVPTATQIATLEKAAKAFDQPKIHAAVQHLTAWAKTNCGALLQTTTG